MVMLASRDEKKAKAEARGRFRVGKTYEQVLEDEQVEAVYIPLPNGMHHKWTMLALKAGKHVLCEKPMSANAGECAKAKAMAESMGKVLMEAAHCFHHPALIKCRELIRNGEIGILQRVEANFYSRIPTKDIRYDCDGTDKRLAGGSLMDNGVYAIHAVRFFSDLEIAKVLSVKCQKAKCAPNRLDDSMDAEIEFECNEEGNDANPAVTGRVSSSFVAILPWDFVPVARIYGTKGQITFYNYLLPSLWHSIKVTLINGKSKTLKVYDQGQTTYEFQLAEFARAIREQPNGGLAQTKAGGKLDDPVGNMRAIDMIYQAAGLPVRVGFEVEKET